MRSKFHFFLPVLILASVALVLGNAQAQNQSVASGCGANVGSVANSNLSVHVECAKRQPELTVEYSRLFGAFEAPLMMALIPSPKLIVDNSFGKEFRAFDLGRNRRWHAHRDLIAFVDRYPFKGARPIQTPLWKAVVTDEYAGNYIAWRASEGLRSERICYFVAPLVDDSGLNNDEPGFYKKETREKHCQPHLRNLSQRVGYTLLILSNDTKEPLTDVHLFFRQNYTSNKIVEEKAALKDLRSHSRKAFIDLPDVGDATAGLIKKFGTANETEAKVGRLPKEFYFAARIAPNEKIIALTDVFFANENSLPAGYLYGIYIFDEFEFSHGGVRHRMKIRPPSLERAARIEVPFGWASQ